MERRRSQRPVAAAGILLGLGLGGFIDGILLHQVLQWHHMLSSAAGYPTDTVSGLEANTLWDGFFHVITWVFTLSGVILLWRAGRNGGAVKNWPTFVGALLIGARGFNLIEGVINHHILGIHHVREGEDYLAWNIGFLVIGAVLVVVGAALLRAGRVDSRLSGSV